MKHKTSVAKSFAYKFTERLAVKLLGMIVGIVLARLLDPSVFGQLAIMMVFINLSQSIIQAGLNLALVQSKEASDVDYSTVFHISMCIATALVLILCITAPSIASFYDSPGLTLQLRIFAVSLFFGAVNSVQIAKLQREMRFRETMICSVIATVLSGALGILLALYGAGIWALIVYNMTSIIITSICMLKVTKWVPKLEFSLERARVLWSYGWRMLASSLLCSFYNDVRSLIIGKKYSASDLGYYDRGNQFPSIISNTLDQAIQSVMLPVYARSQDDKEKLRLLLRRTTALGVFLILPIMTLLYSLSYEIIVVLFTEKWLPSVPYMKALSLAYVSVPIVSSSLVVIKAIGRSDIYMRLEAVRRVIMLLILGISVLVFDSIDAIVIGYVITCIIDMFIVLFPISSLIGFGMKDLMLCCYKAAISDIVMGVMLSILPVVSFSDFLTILVKACVGLMIYIVIAMIIRDDSCSYLIKLMKNHI